jgi:hypothetical protein
MMGRDRRAGFGWSAVAALALAGAALLAPATASARGYTGAQAEAQGDTAQDPYSFPAIKLCCEKKPHHGRRGHWGHKPGTPPDGAHRNVAVNCAMPTSRESFGSMREALDYMRGAPGRISVVPGAPCDISGLSFGSGVVVTTANYGYGVRARVGGASCAQVSAAGAAGSASMTASRATAKRFFMAELPERVNFYHPDKIIGVEGAKCTNFPGVRKISKKTNKRVI